MLNCIILNYNVTIFVRCIMKKILLATLGVALMSGGVNVYAAKSSASISPSLSIVGACSVDASGVSGVFPAQASGSHTPAGIAMAGGSLAVLCTGQAYSIGADAGLHYAAPNRRMSLGGTTFIPYALGIASATGTPLIAGIPAVAGAGWTDNGLAALDVSLPVGGYANTMAVGSVASVVVATKGAAAPGETFTISGITTAALTGLEPVGVYTDTVTVTVVW
jgi:spore coat protein U-like protein